MQKSKIDLFLQDQPFRKFPLYCELSAEECSKLLNTLRDRSGLPSNASVDDILNLFRTKSSVDRFENADSEAFTLMKFINKKIPKNAIDTVFLNWYRFERVDEMKLKSLSDDWSYIWYSGPDDLELFDHTLKWILSVDHSGALYWYEFPPSDKENNSVS